MDGKVIEVDCQNCRRNKVSIVDNHLYFGIVCHECMSRDNGFSVKKASVPVSKSENGKAIKDGQDLTVKRIDSECPTREKTFLRLLLRH